MTTYTKFKEYIWLVNTIYYAKAITFAEINERWLKTDMSEGVEINDSNRFPFDEIKEAFKSNQAKSLSFNEEVIDGLLSLHKDDPSCYPVMALIYSHFDFGNQVYHKDHLHPAAYFCNLKKNESMTEEEYNFYKNSTTVPLKWTNRSLKSLKYSLL